MNRRRNHISVARTAGAVDDRSWLLWTGLLVGMVLSLNQEVSAQVRLQDRTETRFTESGATVAEVPFELVNHHVILPISVNGSKPIRAVLDTGMPNPGLVLYASAPIDDLSIDFDPSLQAHVGGAGGHGERFVARIAPDESVGLPGVAIDHTLVTVLPPLPGFGSYHDGIIGASLFTRFVVELDFDRGVMRLHEPSSFEAPNSATKVPFELVMNAPHVQLAATSPSGELVEHAVVVDLGASHALSLNTDTSEHIRVPERHVDAVLGHGISGDIRGQIARVPSVRLAGFTLTDVVTSFPQQGQQHPRGMTSLGGNLGTGLLHRFKTTFDYSRKQMLLEPGREVDKPFPYDRAGIRLSFGNTLEVEHLIDASPAARAGLEIGDVITRVNGREVDGSDRFDVRDLFEGQGSVTLAVRRGEQTVTARLELRDLI